MFSGNDSGKFFMQKALWCDSLYRQNFPTIEFHCQLILVFGDGVLRPHHLGRGCTEFSSGLAFIMKITPFRPADQEREHSASGGTSFGKPPRHISRFIHCTGVICENCSQHCSCTAGIQQCVCMVGTKIRDGSSQKFVFAGALSLLQSFKGGTNGFPESVMTL